MSAPSASSRDARAAASPQRLLPALTGFALLCGAVAVLATRLYRYGDFASFYQDIATWRLGTDLYAPGTGRAANLNLPHVTALLWPFAFWPIGGAWALWQAFQIVCGCDILRRVMSQGMLRPSPEVLAALILCPATMGQIATAQNGWSLAWLITMAWFARDARRPWLGMWLGLAIAAKPFLLVMLAWLVLRRRWLDTAICLSTIVAVFLVGIVIAGPGSYQVWLARIANIDWEFWPLNWSLQGAWRRAAPAGLPDAIIHVVQVVSLGVVLWRLRTMSLGQASGWVLALSSSLLLSPLGWGYYGWILLAPTAVWLATETSERTWRKWAPLALIWIPPDFFPSLSPNTVGLIALSFAASRTPGHTAARDD